MDTLIDVYVIDKLNNVMKFDKNVQLIKFGYEHFTCTTTLKKVRKFVPHKDDLVVKSDNTYIIRGKIMFMYQLINSNTLIINHVAICPIDPVKLFKQILNMLHPLKDKN